MKARKRMLMMSVVAATVLMAVPGPVGASGPVEITRGEFVTLPGGADRGYTIEGKATMWRSALDGGTTVVRLHVRGLDPDATYPVHVHNAPCSASPAGGGHYQNAVGGAVDDVNEMWPIVETNAAGNGSGYATHSFVARPEAMAIVIHYPPMTSVRLACLDLK